MRPFDSNQAAMVFAERNKAAGPFSYLVTSVCTHRFVAGRWPNENGFWSFMGVALHHQHIPVVFGGAR